MDDDEELTLIGTYEVVDPGVLGFRIDHLSSVRNLALRIIIEPYEEQYTSEVAVPKLDYDYKARPTPFVQIITEQVVKSRKSLKHTEHYQALARLMQAFAVVSTCIDEYSSFNQFIYDLGTHGYFHSYPGSYLIWAFASAGHNFVSKSLWNKVVLRSMLNLLAQDVDDYIFSQFNQH